jgi:hypothetical protein
MEIPSPLTHLCTEAGLGLRSRSNEHFSSGGHRMAESNPFVGTWKLVSWEVTQPDDTIHYLYSKDVVGYLI